MATSPYSTDQEVIAHCRRHGLPLPVGIVEDVPPANQKAAPLHSKAVHALLDIEQTATAILDPQPRYRSKTEARRAELLTLQQQAGDIQAWWYEPIRLWLAPKTTYTPDFLVQYGGNIPLTFYEIKGAFTRSRALDKPKVAARLYPIFRFRLAIWKDGMWQERDIPAY